MKRKEEMCKHVKEDHYKYQLATTSTIDYLTTYRAPTICAYAMRSTTCTDSVTI